MQSPTLLCGSFGDRSRGSGQEGYPLKFHLGPETYTHTVGHIRPDPGSQAFHPLLPHSHLSLYVGPNVEAVTAADVSANQQIKECAKSFLNTNCGMASGGLLIFVSAPVVPHITLPIRWHWREGRCPWVLLTHRLNWVPGALHILVPAREVTSFSLSWAIALLAAFFCGTDWGRPWPRGWGWLPSLLLT